VAERKAQPFVGSNRYYRGRLVAYLRTLSPGHLVSLAQLGPHVKEDFHADQDLEWLRGLVEALVRDGLVTMIASEVGLPDT
jgi:A/G-specific adenine glycosylase